MSITYLTRAQVAERYPISAHTLAKLASEGKGPRFYKPTYKCLYRPEDKEAWIEASLIVPKTQSGAPASPSEKPPPSGNHGKTRPPVGRSARSGLKSLPPSPIPGSSARIGTNCLRRFQIGSNSHGVRLKQGREVGTAHQQAVGCRTDC